MTSKIGKLLWDAIVKEIKNIEISVDIFDETEKDIPVGYQNIRFNVILYANMGDNFLRKYQIIWGGGNTVTPVSLKYVSVVSRYTVTITLNVAASNGLKILACDIKYESHSKLNR